MGSLWRLWLALCALLWRDGRAASQCDTLWRAMEAKHALQLARRRRAVVEQCPALPNRTAPVPRCANPLTRPGTRPVLRGLNARAAWSLYEPEWACESEERIGEYSEAQARAAAKGGEVRIERYAAFGDGPKYVCGLDVLANRSCLVYSIGSRNEYGFEKALKAVHPHCEIHTFDPTLRRGSSFAGAAYSTFHAVGLGPGSRWQRLEPVRPPQPAQAGPGAVGAQPVWHPPISRPDWLARGGQPRLQSLVELMRGLGHAGRAIDILKIDCEGCEWASLPGVFEAMAQGRLRVGQLQLELHLAKPAQSQDTLDAFMAAADRAGLRAFHKEPNVLYSDGYTAIEYAWVHADFARQAFERTHCPGGPLPLGPAAPPQPWLKGPSAPAPAAAGAGASGSSSSWWRWLRWWR